MEILDKAQTQCLTKRGILQNPFLMYFFFKAVPCFSFLSGVFYQGFLSSTCPDHAEIAGEVRKTSNKRNGLLSLL